MRAITNKELESFYYYLINGEKSSATIRKYLRDIKEFAEWLGERTFRKVDVLAYKTMLSEKYALSSVNSILSSLNSFFNYCEWHELKTKTIKIQRQLFVSSEKELTKNEYERLLTTAQRKKNKRLYLLMQTICSTGIRVSELRFVTVESLQKKYAEINCKGKRRMVFYPEKLCRILRLYCDEQKISNDSIFITKNGNPLDRSNIWSDMKKLCKTAYVSEKKVFPHNLRHLFARTYYSIQKDVVRLADILGHSNVNTTRIYTTESGEIHRRQIQKLGLLRC